MILIRHGQSEFNVVFNKTRVDPGIRDPRLTEEGRRQAAAAAAALKAMVRERPVRRLLVSPYTRTLETAAIIAAALDLPIAIEPLVREHAMFVCDIGTHRSHLAGAWPGYRFDHLEECWWPSEESPAQLLERCGRFRARMAATPDWPEVAVVSHWGFIRGLTGRELGNGQLVAHDPTGPWANGGSPAAT